MTDEQMIPKEQVVIAMKNMMASFKDVLHTVDCFADILDVMDNDNATEVPGGYVADVLKGLIAGGSSTFEYAYQQELKRIRTE